MSMIINKLVYLVKPNEEINPAHNVDMDGGTPLGRQDLRSLGHQELLV